MSQKNRRKINNPFSRGYKVMCDRTGFEVYSTQVVRDHHGKVMIPKTFDPMHPTESPLKVPLNNWRPFIMRPEQEPAFEPTDEATEETTWDTLEENWEDIDTNWEDT